MVQSVWNIGDKVRPDLDSAWVYGGTEHEDIMNKDRPGTVVFVPDATVRHGGGTLLVEWESLTETPLKQPIRWTHSDLIVRA